jgi:hypothetical protein
MDEGILASYICALLFRLVRNVVNRLTVPNFLFFKYNSYLTRVVPEKINRMDQCGNITTSS